MLTIITVTSALVFLALIAFILGVVYSEKIKARLLSTTTNNPKEKSPNELEPLTLLSGTKYELKELVCGNFILWNKEDHRAVDLRTPPHEWTPKSSYFASDCIGTKASILEMMPEIMAAKGFLKIADPAILEEYAELFNGTKYELKQLVNEAWVIKDKETSKYVDIRSSFYSWSPKNSTFQDCYIRPENLSKDLIRKTLGQIGTFKANTGQEKNETEQIKRTAFIKI